LERTDYGNLELVIVDNDTVAPDALALLAELRATPNVRVLPFPGAFNYAAMNNHAAAVASGEVLVLLNSDTDVLNPDWLREMVAQACRPDVGVVGAKLLYEDGRVQHAGVVFNGDMDIVHQLRLSAAGDPGANGELAVVRTVLAVTGACLGIRKDVFFEIGQMDEVNFPVGFNDIDLCLRAGDHGYRVVITPFAELIHLESATLGAGVSSGLKRDRYMAERSRFQAFWASVVTADPFHNRNIAYGWEKTDLAAPPRRNIATRMLAKFDGKEVTEINLRWARTLQRLAVSRASSNAELEKGRLILMIVRDSEAAALRQRDAAEQALEIAQIKKNENDELTAVNKELLKIISNLSINYDTVINSNTWKIAKILQVPLKYFKKLRSRANPRQLSP
jgi:GT2 family glycosyltransferase